MNLIAPLGFLGFIGIAVLVLIHLLKPNYQQKVVSSTYVWKLSLRYKKKKVPISRFRNILIVICQVLIIAACTLMLVQPYIAGESPKIVEESVAIIDASANMRASHTSAGGVESTRFERAVERTRLLAQETFRKGGIVSVILAGSEAEYVATRFSADKADELESSLDALTEDGALQCSFGTADMNGALEMAQSLQEENPSAEVTLYTGTTYYNTNGVKVVDVSEAGEWNAAILSCEVTMQDNFYKITVELGCYGETKEIGLSIDINGINGTTQNVGMERTLVCSEDGTQKVEFYTTDIPGISGVYEYETMYVHFEENDSFLYDNFFWVYGGTKETIKIEYFSSDSNPFMPNFLTVIANSKYWTSRYNLEITQVRKNEYNNASPILNGFDVYVFEYEMPNDLPTDGIVLLFQPNKAPGGLGLTFGGIQRGEWTLASGVDHVVMEHVNPENILITNYTKVEEYSGFDVLMYCAGDPVFLVQNEPDRKIAVCTFSVNYADLTIVTEFPFLLQNLFQYFLPFTFEGYVFDVNESVEFRARGASLRLTGPDTDVTFESFPTQAVFSQPGTYTLTQKLISGETVSETLYVKVPAAESNLFRTEEELRFTAADIERETDDFDLLVVLAAVAVFLLAVEWWLQSRENF